MRHVLSIAAAILLLAAGFSALRATAQEIALHDLLPAASEIGPGFVAVDDRARTLGEQAAMFGNPDDAARRLAEWGWRDNAFVVFQATELTAGGAPAATVDVSLTRFASAAASATALAFFLDDRVAVLGQWEAQQLTRWAGGDEVRTIAGPVPGGYDTTVYARSGPLLLRVSATAAPGQTAPAPEAIARGIIERFTGRAEPVGVGVMQPAAESLWPSLASFQTLPLDSAGCFRVAGEGVVDLPAVAERLAVGEDVAGALEDLGWAGGVYRQFACDPAPGRAGWIDLSVHRFPDAAAAVEAVAVFAETRGRGMAFRPAPLTPLGQGDAALAGPAVNGTEYTRYVSQGPLLFAVTGVAPDGDPRPDVEAVVAALIALPLTELAPPALAPPELAPPEPAPTSTPYTLGEAAPGAAVAPTATAIPPTPMPPPTALPLPTATAVPPTPVPTATPPPTAPPPTPTPAPTEPPALIQVTVPPQPTATMGPQPTPTPRVIHLPTPDAG